MKKGHAQKRAGPAPPPPRSTPQGRGGGSPFPTGLDDKQRNAAKGWMMDEVRGQGKKTARALAGASVHEPTLLPTVLRQSRARQTGYIYIYIYNKINIYIYIIYIYIYIYIYARPLSWGQGWKRRKAEQWERMPLQASP